MLPSLRTLFLGLSFICGPTFLASCATIFAPDTDLIAFDSEPQGAVVYIRGQKACVTPCKIEVRRQLEGTPSIVLKLAGYKTREENLEKAIAATALFNLGFITTTSGVTSWGIDAVTGKMFEYQPKSYFFELEKKGTLSSLSSASYVAANFEALRSDIARGEGKYLLAYTELFSPVIDPFFFQNQVKHNAHSLLQIDTPSELDHNLSSYGTHIERPELPKI